MTSNILYYVRYLFKIKSRVVLIAMLFLFACGTGNKNAEKEMQSKNYEYATFGGGCFWCIEAIFEQLDGVESVVSGYAGGNTENPTYEEVCTGNTGHAEVCLIKFNPEIISYEQLLEVFFASHDPTTPNRQGADIGSQYRSIIFWHNEQQKESAEDYINQLNERSVFGQPVVTEVKQSGEFYPAEDYHQDYFRRNPSQAYCQFNIVPKLNKLKIKYKNLIKKNE